ncbi:glycosyltransferase family 25 protein [Aestuariivirga litoralis]|nr:glycosyltransferase family 25 protein [Aestuariivirga litoralis]
MNLFVINLERSATRRSFMAAQLQRQGLAHSFFPAVDGRARHAEFAHHYDDERCLKSWRRPMTRGEVGCFASHYLLWERCVQVGAPIVVMEDDVILADGIGEAVEIAQQLVANHDFLRLSGVVDVPRVTLAADLAPPWRLVRFLAGPLGTQCYVIAPRAAQALLDKATQWLMPVDNYIDAFWLHGVISKGLEPFRARHDDSQQSEISDTMLSPSQVMRDKVPRVKRFSRRMYDEFRRHAFNFLHQPPSGGVR